MREGDARASDKYGRARRRRASEQQRRARERYTKQGLEPRFDGGSAHKRRRRLERRCDQRLAAGSAQVAAAGPDPPAAREALMTAPHSRRGGETRSGPSHAGPGDDSLGSMGGGGGSRGAVISASPPTPPASTQPHLDAGCTRGAEQSASWPAAEGKCRRRNKRKLSKDEDAAP